MRILVTSGVNETEFIRKNFPMHDIYTGYDECEDAEVLIGFSSQITNQFLEKLPSLKWFQTLSSGYNTMDLEYLKRRGIKFSNGRGLHGIAISEDIISKMLILNRHTKIYMENQKKSLWNPYPEMEIELSGSTAGILGAGVIATETAKKLKAFGMKTIGFRKSEGNAEYFDEMYCGKENLSTVLMQSDYLIITVALNEDTKHMINSENIGLLHKNAVIINIARGEIVEKNALYDVLFNHKIRAAGLDVTDPEPLPPENPLWQLDNVYITPHRAGKSNNRAERNCKLIKDNIENFQAGKELLNRIV
jgi:phosphoglycerate dehydrogenase-like enzyme